MIVFLDIMLGHNFLIDYSILQENLMLMNKKMCNLLYCKVCSTVVV